MKLFTTSLAVIFILQLHAVVYTGDQAAQLVPGADKVIVNDTRNTIAFVHFLSPSSQPDHSTWLRELLGAGTETSFELYQTNNDQLGWTHYRYRQLYHNVPVEHGVYYVHVKDGNVLSANGEFYTGISVPTQAAVAQSAAELTARNDLRAQQLADPSRVDATQLVVYRDEKGAFTLAWKVDAWSTVPVQRYTYYIDAAGGKIAGRMSRICEIDALGSAATAFNGTQTITADSLSATNYRLKDNARNIYTHAPGPVDIVDADNNWTSTVNMDNYATDAHWGAEMTHDFYLNNFGLLGQDGMNMLADVQAHDGMYVNAFWTGTYMAFGDGDMSQYYPLTSLEIVSHEYTHGVTQFSAALIYAGESGALNESFSDIFGNTVRFLYSPSVATWLVGDQIVIPNAGGSPFRDMSNPNAFQCADTYMGLFFNNGDIVHYDSGIQNFWYYLLCQGGSGTNDIGNVFSVSGIGMSDAMAITYRNLSVYLTPSSTFADAATYAEQSAVDLFGSCSNQAIQTANAWYAVGVGTPFSGSVVANFAASPAISCSAPATVSFLNNSFNGTNYQWDFGDSQTSTAQSPTHTYVNPGTYNVTLIVTGTGNCIGADTLTITGAVVVNNNPGPVAASCTPGTTSYCCGYGITNVTFHTINWNSGDALEGYRDFTCADSTLIVAGNPYPISISTNANATSGYDESVKVWIDYNNDGQFNNTNELVYADATPGVSTHTGIINTPVSATLNTRLRMRVISDASTNNITSACYTPQRGQTEDYMVYFVANTLPPIANFTANITTVPTGNFVSFTDLTQNAPTAWNWTATGGTPSTSTQQNPTIQYNTVGVYPVKLVATNGFGSDSLTQVTYINVVNVANICQMTTMTSGNGLLYDSGGPTGNYLDNQNCSFFINPGCVTNLSITFNYIDIEATWDYIVVYDGSSAAAPLLGSFSGSYSNVTLNSTSGQLFIVFTSDVSVVYSGFDASWTSTPASSTTPAASFSYTPAAPANNTPVQFTDQSLYNPTSWFWDFGDSQSSTLQNPQHIYTNPGTYTVTLIACNCQNCDTTTFVITILPSGIEEAGSSGAFTLAPNPFAVTTTLQLSDAFLPSETRIEICDLSGRVVKNVQPNSRTITLSREGMSAGVYFVNVYADGNFAGSKKMVIGQ